MKKSKHVTIWMCGLAFFGTLLIFLTPARAQEGEALSADAVLMPKMMSEDNKTPNMLSEVGKNEAATESRASSSLNSAMESARKELEEGLDEAKSENEDEAVLAQKVELAKAMHDIRPTHEQVDSAVYRSAMNLPPNERNKFVASMQSMLNYNAIERISVDAMVDIYTKKELEAMVGYFSKPEATSASRKLPVWAREVQPEIVRMIDRALMRIRTGQ
ncbi:MAG: hypothetical protein ACLFU1_02025 [Alphaproteobacteria bacterium]